MCVCVCVYVSVRALFHSKYFSDSTTPPVMSAVVLHPGGSLAVLCHTEAINEHPPVSILNEN